MTTAAHIIDTVERARAHAVWAVDQNEGYVDTDNEAADSAQQLIEMAYERGEAIESMAGKASADDIIQYINEIAAEMVEDQM